MEMVLVAYRHLGDAEMKLSSSSDRDETAKILALIGYTLQFIDTSLHTSPLEVGMSESTLMNFVTVDYPTEGDLELSRYRWEENREKYLPQLMAKGLNRFTVLRIWNKEGVFRLGFWYEYKDPDAFAACKEIWGEIESQSKKRAPSKIFANRGVVLEDNRLPE